MRFLHTSDWHLGRTLFGVSLVADQAHVLDQFVRLATEARVDAVLVAGDIYDRLTPPADAVRLLDDVLTRLVRKVGVPVVVIAGNHDSGERLGFGSRVFEAAGLHVAGTRPLVLPLGDAHGPVDVVAVPYAEPAEVAARIGTAARRGTAARIDGATAGDAAMDSGGIAGRSDSAGDEILDHEGALAAAIAEAEAGAARPPASRRIAVAHAFVAGGLVSESERPLVLGNAALVRPACFDAFQYAALGHLHRPQKVGRAEVRYSGSLLKYSFDEAGHRKSVSVVELDRDGGCAIEQVELSPRRDVRVLEGTLDEIRAGASKDARRDDYVLVRLTDRGAILDAIGKVREEYPNCLHVDRESFFGERAASTAPRLDHRRHDETELFEAFFLEATGEAADEAERQVFAEALEAVRRGDAA